MHLVGCTVGSIGVYCDDLRTSKKNRWVQGNRHIHCGSVGSVLPSKQGAFVSLMLCHVTKETAFEKYHTLKHY